MAAADDFFAQRQSSSEAGPLVGLLRTVTATLTSSTARPVIDVFPIPASTNEMGVFQRCLASLMRAYGRGDLFRLVTYDAGACSKENARAVRDLGLHYLFAIKSSQPTSTPIEQNPRASLVVMVLRRIVYTLLALWRGVSLRSDAQRTRPWRELMRDILLAAITATAKQLRSLRDHCLRPAPS